MNFNEAFAALQEAARTAVIIWTEVDNWVTMQDGRLDSPIPQTSGSPASIFATFFFAWQTPENGHMAGHIRGGQVAGITHVGKKVT